jgi:hypothetical protein
LVLVLRFQIGLRIISTFKHRKSDYIAFLSQTRKNDRRKVAIRCKSWRYPVVFMMRIKQHAICGIFAARWHIAEDPM